MIGADEVRGVGVLAGFRDGFYQCLTARSDALQQVELDDLGPSHNPARAARVDGMPLDAYGNPLAGCELVEITPDIVEVSLQQIRAVAMKLAQGI